MNCFTKMMIIVVFIATVLSGCKNEKNIPTVSEVSYADIPSIATNNLGEPVQTDNKAEESKKRLVPYKGTVKHIFFHPLIIYPELAFDNDRMSQGYNDWMITVKEFKKILEYLYNNNYILVDIHETFEEKEIGLKKKYVKKEIEVPEGKKPLILSIDDLNYYEYMIKNGNAHKLVLGSDGEIAAQSVNMDGEILISKDNEIVPIIDQFVKEHSDFSLNGAKGIIALTGYEGVLGYKTHQMNSPGFQSERSEVQKITKRLKETGWMFACHGYGHLAADTVSIERFTRDTDRWKNEVQPLVGPTDIYIYPFGASVSSKDPKFKYMQNTGFKVFCSVGYQEYTRYLSDSIMTDRTPVDGLTLRRYGERVKDLFESDKVIDSVRPN